MNVFDNQQLPYQITIHFHVWNSIKFLQYLFRTRIPFSQSTWLTDRTLIKYWPQTRPYFVPRFSDNLPFPHTGLLPPPRVRSHFSCWERIAFKYLLVYGKYKCTTQLDFSRVCVSIICTPQNQTVTYIWCSWAIWFRDQVLVSENILYSVSVSKLWVTQTTPTPQPTLPKRWWRFAGQIYVVPKTQRVLTGKI